MFRKKAAPLDRATARRQFLALKPVRNPVIAWEEVENGILLIVTPRSTPLLKITQFLLPLSEDERKRRVALDPIAADVWRRCDGATPIGTISGELQKKYNLGAREAELSLQQFFQTLGRRGFVAFGNEQASQTPQNKPRKK